MNRDTADDVMTATLANTRPTIDRLALEQMEKRLGPDHPAVVRARDHLTAWEGRLAELRRTNEATRARIDAERAARSAELRAEAEAQLAARQEAAPLEAELRALVRRRGTPAYHEPAVD